MFDGGENAGGNKPDHQSDSPRNCSCVWVQVVRNQMIRPRTVKRIVETTSRLSRLPTELLATGGDACAVSAVCFRVLNQALKIMAAPTKEPTIKSSRTKR